jgi:hypothetical protein
MLNPFRHGLILIAACALVAGSTGCAFWRANESEAEAPAPGPRVDAPSDYRPALHSTVIEQLGLTEEDEVDPKLRYARPYWYKEYVVYPGGPSDYRTQVSERESRIVPAEARVEIEKIRYATKLWRDRADAVNDNDYFRGRGREVIIYQLRNGRWQEVSSMFVAERVEQKIAGEWQPMTADEQLELARTDEDPGFFQRMWNMVFGR